MKKTIDKEHIQGWKIEETDMPDFDKFFKGKEKEDKLEEKNRYKRLDDLMIEDGIGEKNRKVFLRAAKQYRKAVAAVVFEFQENRIKAAMEHSDKQTEETDE